MEGSCYSPVGEGGRGRGGGKEEGGRGKEEEGEGGAPFTVLLSISNGQSRWPLRIYTSRSGVEW